MTEADPPRHAGMGRDVLRTFPYRHLAEIACEMLIAEGIEAEVISDDCGAINPALQFAGGALLVVRPEDAERSERILAEAEEDARTAAEEEAMKPVLGFEAILPDSYEGALEKVAAALKAEGFGILTRIDVRATLKEKLGADFRPYAILGACNPPLAHRALSYEAQAGLLLPCNVTVEALPEGGSLVRIADPAIMLATGGFEGDPVLREVAAEARTRLLRVAQALGG